MNNDINPRPRIRLLIYITTGVANILAAYLKSKGYIGDSESIAIMAVSALVSGLAAVNTPYQSKV